MPGGRIDIEVAPDLAAFPGKLDAGLRGAIGTAGKVGAAMGLAFGAAGIAVAAKDIIRIGNDFTTSLNTMQAVSSATAEQMAAVSARAKELGNDISLPNTSASDAAAAMTELAKGGFSVEQSMAAAKGTLQLAAAAQVDAATAATIQSQALQAFGKDATFAATAADVLANTANASSAEMTDVAYGLQQAGTVANQFGVSMQDTATTIGLFANAGITGSDAGTLLKSALLALTDQGKPAQAAIEELGLTVYDAQGKFVGMQALFGQLEQASKSMTDEQYQAATATLFGSDAMRLAGVAAEQGVAGYDRMRSAIDRQGSAAEVAAAKTQGLPGAMAAAGNAAENLALQVYDLVDGPLESLATGATDLISNATPALVGGLETVGTAVGNLGKMFLGLPAPVQAAAVALAAIKVTNLDDFAGNLSGRTTGAVRGFTAEMRENQRVFAEHGRSIGTVSAALSVLESRVPAVQRMGDAYSSVTARTNEFATTQRAAGVASGGLAGQLRLGAASASSFAGIVGGSAAAGVRGLGSAVSGVTAALGGPWVLGLAAAVGVVTQLISAGQRAGRVMDTYRQSVDDAAKANANLHNALSESNGLVNNGVQDIVTGKIDALRASSQKLADEAPGFWGNASAAIVTAWDAIDGSVDGSTATNTHAAETMSTNGARIVEAMDKTKLSSTELGKIVTGDSSKFLDFTQNLIRTGGASVDLAQAMMTQRDAFIEARSSATQVKAAIEEIESKSIGAAGGVDALTSAVGRLREDGRTAESAQKALTLALDGFRSAVGNGGAAAVDAAGKIDLSTTAGVRLDDQMGRVAQAWDEAGAAARTAATEQGMSAEDTEAAVRNAQQQVRDQFIQTATELLGSREKAEALANVFLTWPTEATTKINVLDADARAKVEAFLRDNKSHTIDVLVRTTMLNETPAGLPPVVAPRDLEDLMTPGRAGGGRLPGFAGGGRMPSTGPGTERTDGIYAVTSDGRGIAMVDGDEWVINPESSEKYDRELAAINAGTFPKLPGYAKGGRIASDRTHAFLAPESGKEYQYGGVGNPSWDCSAYSSAAYAMLKGLDPYTRWFTTESDFPSLGFLPGLGPRSALNIGVHNGGGGMYSHMASALDGTPFESGSNGVRYGAGAASPSDSQFENHWHLPESAFNPPADGSMAGTTTGTGGSRSSTRKATWAEKDELSLDSARIAVRQAIEDRDKALADPKKSQADKDQAQNKVAQAEQRVKDLESKKSAAESGANAGPAPAAPGLTGSMTDDEIRLRELEQAIDKADADRNEVYDDPERFTERESADLSLQRAINALAAEQKRQADELRKPKAGDRATGGAGGARSFSEQLGDIAADFVSSNTADLFSVLGINDSAVGRVAGLVNGIATWDPNGENTNAEALQSPPSFSDEEIAKQGPVSPGTPGWFEELVKTLQVPMVLRDSGGPLPHGVAALNLSGEEEWVLTGQQRRDLAAMRAERGGGLSREDLAHVARTVTESIGRPINFNNYAQGGDAVGNQLVKVEQRRVQRVRLGGR